MTGYHNQAGNVADYLVNPTFASPKIRKGRNVADVQATFQGLNIGLMTASEFFCIEFLFLVSFVFVGISSRADKLFFFLLSTISQ